MDREDERVKVERQEQDGRALAHRRGDEVVEVYVENDTSAYKRRKIRVPDGTTALRVYRPEYRRALADLAEGVIDVLICYDLDRMVRDPRDLEDLIDVVESTGRKAISVTGSLQLENNAGITMARVGVAVANQSSRDTARRVARAREATVAAGQWPGGGRRAYGLTADRRAVVADEADVIASIAADVLAGRTINAIKDRLNAEGVPTASKRKEGWSSGAVRHVVTKPAVAGLLVHKGEIVGKAPWPAILDEETWRQVCDELSGRTPRADNRLRYWLSGILLCSYDDCGLPLRGNGGRYWCGNAVNGNLRGCGRIAVSAPRAEDAIEELLFERAARSRTKTKASPVASLAPDDTQLTELATMWAKKEISLAEYRVARAELIKQTARPETPRMPAWVGPTLREDWKGYDPATKRRVAAAFLEGIIVHPAPTRRWDVNRLEPHFRET